MTTQYSTRTLRPGLLVSLKTSIFGGVSYDKKILEQEHVVEGAQKAKWETERTITDPEEHEAAIIARGKAMRLIRAVCAKSAFGLICPETAAEKLEDAIKEARAIADAFNEGSSLTRVSIYVMTGRIAPDDVEAVKAINSEVRELLSDMENGISRLDVKQIRDAATKAKEMGAMLTEEAEARIQIAVDTARSAAKEIVKAGDGASKVDRAAMNKIASMRTAFLDLDDAAVVSAPKKNATPQLDLAGGE